MILYGTKIFKNNPIKYETYSMMTKDGGKVQICICVEPKPVSTKNVIILNHGLTNAARANYCKQFCYEANRKGF